MADEKQPSRAEQLFGDFAPALVGFPDDVFFGQARTLSGISPKTLATLSFSRLLNP